MRNYPEGFVDSPMGVPLSEEWMKDGLGGEVGETEGEDEGDLWLVCKVNLKI